MLSVTMTARPVGTACCSCRHAGPQLPAQACSFQFHLSCDSWSQSGDRSKVVAPPSVPHEAMLLTSVAVGSLVAAGAANAAGLGDSLLGPPGLSLADLSIGDWFGGLLYSAGQQANEAVQDQLSALSFTILAVIFGAGLETSLFPCTLGVLPLTLGYTGAFDPGKDRAEVVGNSVAFSLGLATTLAILGVKAYGQVGQGLPVAASGLAIIMGLNILEVNHRQNENP